MLFDYLNVKNNLIAILNWRFSVKLYIVNDIYHLKHAYSFKKKKKKVSHRKFSHRANSESFHIYAAADFGFITLPWFRSRYML